MIQLKQNEKSKEGYFDIYIDDNLSSSLGWAYRPLDNPNSPFQYTSNSIYGRLLITQTLEDFEPFSAITFNNLFSWMKRGHSIIISPDFDEDIQNETISISFYFSPNLTVWNEKFSFAEYCGEFENNCEKIIESNYELTFEGTPALRLEFYLNKFLFPINEVIVLLEKMIEKVNQKSIETLQQKFNENFVETIFDFPENLKIPCQQYLLYFAQFLQDLDINATSNLKEKAGKVLFSVTPTDDAEALDKIREALAVYLNLPSTTIVYDDSFAAMRLQQQIENLQHSQRMTEREIRSSERELRLAQTVIESQDKVIHQKDTIIEQQNKVIEKITSKSIMMDSLENKSEFEKVFDGLEFGESKELKEKLGIKFNPLTSLKTFGRKLTGSDNEITSLNLNEGTVKIIER